MPGLVSSTTSSGTGSHCFLFQSSARNERIGAPSEAAAAFDFAIFASNAGTAFGSIFCSRGIASGCSDGSVTSCGCVRICRCCVMTLRSTGWLNHIAIMTGLPGSVVLRYHAVRISLMVGVVKEKVYGLPSVLPSTDLAAASMVTSYLAEYGSAVFGSGVKISVVVPDQRKVPLMAGET